MRNLGVVLLLCLCLMACSAFSFRYYGLSAQSYEGALLGPTPADDIPLKTCEPDAQVKGKCVVMLTDEFTRFRDDYARLQTELKACQENGSGK